MSPAQAKADYAAALTRAGDTLVLIGTSGNSAPLRCRVTGFQPDDVVVDLQQGDRKVILLADDVSAALGGGALKRASKMIWNGKTLTVKSIDDASRRVQGVLIAYEIQVAGA